MTAPPIRKLRPLELAGGALAAVPGANSPARVSAKEKERDEMIAATQKIAEDLEKRDAAAKAFYRAGVKYITALDEFIDARKAKSDRELTSSRERVRLMEAYLHRLFPDEFADTSSAAE